PVAGGLVELATADRVKAAPLEVIGVGPRGKAARALAQAMGAVPIQDGQGHLGEEESRVGEVREASILRALRGEGMGAGVAGWKRGSGGGGRRCDADEDGGADEGASIDHCGLHGGGRCAAVIPDQPRSY